MLLRRLVEYAEAQNDTTVPEFYARKAVRWMLDIEADGTFRGFSDVSEASDPERRSGVRFPVPAITRTVGISPALAVDTVEYVLGWVAEDGKPDRVAQQHRAFQSLIRQWAEAEPTGPAGSIVAFYERNEDKKVAVPEKWSRGDLVAFRIGTTIACETQAARRFWARVADDRKGSGRSGLCLVCGRHRPLLKTIPQQIPRRWLPGATQSASLVSVNESVHGYELQKFLIHTPVCSDCGLKFMSALSSLLSDERHSWTLPGQDSRFVWWVVGSSTYDPMGALDQPDERQVQELLSAPASGGRPSGDDLSTFCSVIVGGNVARVVVRDWVELPLPQVKDNILKWFLDHEVVDYWTGQVKPIRLTQLARASGRWKPKGGSQGGEWVRFGATGEDRPQAILHALLRAALFHRPLPPKLLTHVVNRIRADGRIDSARAALIRLCLRRYPALSEIERERLTPVLNVNDTNPAYVAGRIFAVLDDLQQTVFRMAKLPLNTTFADRYLARAITNPQAAIVAGRRTAGAWLRRLRGPLRRPAWANAYQRQLDELFDKIAVNEGIPNAAVLAQKAFFILGYHHQRAAIRAERLAAAAAKRTDVPPALDEELPAPEGESA